MANTIKISGISDELLQKVDQRWKGRHFADRSEYVRDLIRSDVLSQGAQASQPSIAEGIKEFFGEIHEAVKRGEISEDEIATNVDHALKSVRMERNGRTKKEGR